MRGQRYWRIRTALLAMAGLLAGIANAASQPIYEVVYDFPAVAGQARSPLLHASDGALYGTTSVGGADGAGTIFVLRSDPAEGLAFTTLHEFEDVEGGGPTAGLIEGTDGALYGTTPERGAAGLGTIFKITPEGTFTLLHTFTGPDGRAPRAALVQASDGNFYGTTSRGGAFNAGTIFRLTPAGLLTTLHSFDPASGAAEPWAGLLEGQNGELYGGTRVPGALFKVTTGGTFTILHQFPSSRAVSTDLVEGTDGNFYGALGDAFFVLDLTFFRLAPGGDYTEIVPFVDRHVYGSGTARMRAASDGNFYGTTAGEGPNGAGTAFKLTPWGDLTVLHAFTAEEGASASGLVEAGMLFYGVTWYGGIAENGLVFSMTHAGNLSVVHRFSGPSGGLSVAGPTLGTDGYLYVTTTAGGSLEGGTVTRMAPDGSVSVVHAFSGPDGIAPAASLIEGIDGFFYGVAFRGGCHGLGTIFRLSSAGAFELLHCFAPGEGAYPAAPLIQASDGNFYGTTVRGGVNDLGTIFVLTPTGRFATVYSFNLDVPFSPTYTAFPAGALLEASDGRVYGTTVGPGDEFGGTVFEINPSGTITVRTQFYDPGVPIPPPVPRPGMASRVGGGLVEGSDGSLYGVACCGYNGNQVFRLDPGNGRTVFAPLYGSKPVSAPILGHDGYFYGTASAEVSSLIYRLDTNGTMVGQKSISALEGELPVGALVEVADGVFYGTTARGGRYGRGVIFRVTFP